MQSLLIQMNVGDDKAANITQAEALVAEGVAATRPRLICLPELWTCLGGSLANRRAQAEALPPATGGQGGAAYEFLRGLARKHDAYVHGGSMTEQKGDRLLNTTVVFDPTGEEIARYSKIHLFDIVTPDGVAYRESDNVDPGSRVVTCQIDGVTLGMAICYDIRFPELFRALRDAGAKAIVLPAAFAAQTGKDHWEPLLRARAIETQCWFLAPATWGAHKDASGGVRATYGHSLVCDPWGHIVARASDGKGVAAARLDWSLVERVRADIPLASHRRLPFPVEA